MDKASLRLSGRVAAHGNGRIGNEKFTLTASTGFANGGTVSLRATPGFSPAYSEESKKLNFQGDSVGDVANISNLSNIDVQVSTTPPYPFALQGYQTPKRSHFASLRGNPN